VAGWGPHNVLNVYSVHRKPVHNFAGAPFQDTVSQKKTSQNQGLLRNETQMPHGKTNAKEGLMTFAAIAPAFCRKFSLLSRRCGQRAAAAILAFLTLSSPLGTAAVNWTGAASTDWGTPANWSAAAVPGAADDAVIPTSPTGGRFPLISSGTYAVHKLTIQSGAAVTQTGGVITVRDLIINVGGTYSQQGGQLNLDHQWKNSGAFTATGGTVEFRAGAEGDFTSLNQFYNVIVDAGVEPTLFDKTGANAINVAGDFINNSVTLVGVANAKFNFNGVSDQIIFSASTDSTFGSVAVTKSSGTLTLTSRLLVAGDVTINDGTVDLGTNSLSRKTYGGSFALNGDSVLLVGGPFPSNFANVAIGTGAAVQYTDVIRLAIAPVTGSMRIRGLGTPGRAYRLQCTGSLSSAAWVDLPDGNLTADAAGRFEFLDSASAGIRFYRCVCP
jgi:hypothetical protein